MTVGYQMRQAPAPADKLSELEQRVGAPLPAAYRNYLLQQDGGRLEPNNEAAATIFGVGDVPEWADIWETLEVYTDRVPNWLVPVADDAYGNLFCLSVREADRGSVWFWDHEEEADEGDPPTEDNLTLKANSWPAFLSLLEPAATVE